MSPTFAGSSKRISSKGLGTIRDRARFVRQVLLFLALLAGNVWFFSSGAYRSTGASAVWLVMTAFELGWAVSLIREEDHK
jgi:hypothetical protein